MLIYPARFPLEAQDKVETAKIREGLRFNQAKESARWTSEKEALRIRYVLRIWQVFVTEAARLRLWHLKEMDAHCRELLRLLAIDVGDHHGLPSLVGHVSAGILPEVQRQFEQSAEWQAYQQALRAVARHFRRQTKEAVELDASVSPPEAASQAEKPGPLNAREKFVMPILRRKGWSIVEWAQYSDVDPHTANDYLKGTTRPYRSTRKKLADSLEVAIEDLPR